MILRRIRWIATGAAAAMVVVIVVVTLTTRNETENTASSLVPAPLAVGAALREPPRLPSIPLINEDGRPTSLTSFKGKWVIFAPAMTDCHEVCPMTTGAFIELESMLRKAGLASHVIVAEVTVDPWRDHPARLRAYKRMTGADFKMLTGSVPNILRLWKRLGILIERVPVERPPPIDWYTHKPETLNIVHSDGLFVLDPAGNERIVVTGMPKLETGHTLSSALHRLLDAEGVHNLQHPEAPWTASQLLEDLYWGMGREIPASLLPQNKAPSRQAAQQELKGSPHPLTALHEQAGELLGSFSAMQQRLRQLRGYPVVINVWASWCVPCKEEFPLFASASARYGRNVAFLGFDSNDIEGNARSFLKSHPVSYPSYRGAETEFAPIEPLHGTPTTIYLNAAGKIVHTHIGQYESQETLNYDIERYALGLHHTITGSKRSPAG